MIYLNNAATSYRKPPCVNDAINKCLLDLPVGQFRSNQCENNLILDCKDNISKFINVKKKENIFFTSGATESFNLIINGLKLNNTHVLISVNEHNSVIRPLYNSKENIDIELIKCDEFGYINPLDIESQIIPNTKAIFINHCSNVTGIVQDINKIGEIAKKHNLIFIVDVAQSLGCIKIDVESANIGILVFTAHKSLMGISGLGGFYLKGNIDVDIVKFGGNAKNSHLIKIDKNNKEFEVGTQNIVAIAALKSSTDFLINEVKLNTLYANELKKSLYLYSKLKKVENLIIYSNDNYNKGPLFSFNINYLDPSDVSYILYNSYEVITRVGLHCAPLIHKNLNTLNKGTVRISLSYYTTYSEIDDFIKIIHEITSI